MASGRTTEPGFEDTDPSGRNYRAGPLIDALIGTSPTVVRRRTRYALPGTLLRRDLSPTRSIRFTVSPTTISAR